MRKWLRRVRGAVGMGLTWAVGWALGGLLIGVASIVLPGLPWDLFFEVFDAPLPAMAVPGFFAGMFFSTVLGVAGRRRRFSELFLSKFAAWGVAGGLLLLAFPFVLVGVGLASTEGSSPPPLSALAVVAGTFILFSVVSASATLVVARKAEGGTVSESGESEDLVDREMQKLPAGETLSSTWTRPATEKDLASRVGGRPSDA